MRGAPQFAAWLLLLTLGLLPTLTSCATPMSMRVEQPGDVSQYRTWGWARAAGGEVKAPAGESTRLALARQIGISMRARGFENTPNRPDILVRSRLEVRQQFVQVTRGGAAAHLSSLHDSPSYSIETTRTELEAYEIAELEILAIDRREGRVIWRGTAKGRFPDSFAPHLEEAVSQLLEQMPSPRP